MGAIWFLSILISFSILSMLYVFAIRGQVRYASFTEYVRKGWPIFTPFNCVLYFFTKSRAKGPIQDLEKFNDLKKIQDNWQVIKEEAVKLYEAGDFDQIKDPNSDSFYDIGFRTFYKYGWSKFYLKWYGYTHKSAQKRCPKTLEILKEAKSVNGAMFSILPPGSQLTRHLDPVACSLRYHLGLKTPNDDNCFINVDGHNLSWRDGEAFMFDETYLHYAKNNTDDYRLILMCDVERPLFLIGFIINFFLKIAMRLSIVPNTSEDKRGFANKVFSSLSPLLKKTKALKKTKPLTYKLIKHSVNFIIICIILGLIAGLVYGLGRLF